MGANALKICRLYDKINSILDKLVMGDYEMKYKHEGLAHSWLCSDKEVVEELDLFKVLGKKFNTD